MGLFYGEITHPRSLIDFGLAPVQFYSSLNILQDCLTLQMTGSNRDQRMEIDKGSPQPEKCQRQRWSTTSTVIRN